jgi:hypothetical protein
MILTVNSSQTHARAVTVLVASLNLISILFMPMPCYGQVGENIAPLAALSGKGTDLRAVVDGVKQQEGIREWIGGNPHTWNGWITYPKLELKWKAPQRVIKVILCDRSTQEEHMAACVLEFSDGSEVHVFAVPYDGSAKTKRTRDLSRLGVLELNRSIPRNRAGSWPMAYSSTVA